VPSLVVDSPLGLLTLTEAGDNIVALAWGAGLRARNTPLLSRAAEQLEEYFAGRRRDFDLPLDPAGTPFRRRVWSQMQRIPFGRTVSYGTLADRLGTAARAVGGACGANPIPILIPCHRVLAGDGRIGGYSGGGGVDTKRFLLALEGVACAPQVTTRVGAS
jgi:methylated-DNA-[protein]-cysteine S-methyltransferase